jgi:hypothetical protein
LATATAKTKLWRNSAKFGEMCRKLPNLDNIKRTLATLGELWKYWAKFGEIRQNLSSNYIPSISVYRIPYFFVPQMKVSPRLRPNSSERKQTACLHELQRENALC